MVLETAVQGRTEFLACTEGMVACHTPVYIMFGVKQPTLLTDTLWREVGDCAKEAIHAEVMGVGHTIALGQPKVGNL